MKLDNLIKDAKCGDHAAIESLVTNNIGLVWSIVHRFKNSHYDKEDLFQIGCIGLMKAIYHFDSNYQVQFSTYAVPIIMGEIKRFFRDDGSIKVSRSLKELNIKINKLKDKMAAEGNIDPTIEDIALRLNEDTSNIILAMDSSFYPTSLSEPIYEKDGSKLMVIDRIEDKKNISMLDKLALEMEVSKLDEKEQFLLYLRYNLDYKQEKIASILGISQVQVSRKEKKIIEKLRKRLIEE